MKRKKDALQAGKLWYNTIRRRPKARKIHIWAHSSVGRAFGSHPRGRGFESLWVHHFPSGKSVLQTSLTFCLCGAVRRLSTSLTPQRFELFDRGFEVYFELIVSVDPNLFYNVIERLNREIRRRTRVVGTFPDGNSALMLVCARLRHVAGTQWGNKKYMNMKHLEAALEDVSIAG